MLPDRESNPGPLTYESGALPIALRGPACLVVQHRKHGTKTKGDTGIHVTRHCRLYSIRKMPCFVLFFFLPYFYFPYFLYGLSIAYQINPYIKRNLEYISIQAFHFFKL